MKGFYHIVDKICETLMAVGLGAIVVILGMQIVRRLLKCPTMWAEEVCRYTFIWLLFIGAAKAFSKGGHLTVDIFFVKFPRKMQLILSVIFYIGIVCFSAYLLYSGIQLVKFQWNSPMYTVPWMKLGWVDLCVPFGSALTILYVLREIYYMVTKGTGYFEKEEGAPK